MLRYLLYPFLAYRSFAEPMLVFAGVALPVWLVFRLFRHRTSEHPASLGREILLAIVVVYLAAAMAKKRRLASSTNAGATTLMPGIVA